VDQSVLEQRVRAWAEARPDIRAILVVGSRARRDHPADEWSDLDLILFTTDIRLYARCMDWIGEIGDPWLCVPFGHMDGVPEHLALFDGGHKIDFAFSPLDELRSMVEGQALSEVYERGYAVMLDKDGLAARLPAPSFRSLPIDRPSEDIFLATIDAFWYHAAMVAKQIRRRELWVAKSVDNKMKEYVLIMMEWHARATHGWDHDTWQGGRFLAEWTDSQTRHTLPNLFGHYDAADGWWALLTTIGLFRRLASEIASHLGYTYPVRLDEEVTGYINTLYAGDRLE
jgi:aminoglycoside 6-adenylyltransferase